MLTRLLVHLREWAGVLALVLVLTGGVAYAVATIGSADVINESLRGVDVRDRSLSGADLGVRVRSARQPADGPASACGLTPDFDECTTVLFSVPRPQRLLLVGSGEWSGQMGATANGGECRFSVGADLELGLRRFGEFDSGASSPFNFAMNSVTPVLDAGAYEIGIDCRDTAEATGDMVVRRAELSVAALGDGSVP